MLPNLIGNSINNLKSCYLQNYSKNVGKMDSYTTSTTCRNHQPRIYRWRGFGGCVRQNIFFLQALTFYPSKQISSGSNFTQKTSTNVHPYPQYPDHATLP